MKLIFILSIGLILANVQAQRFPVLNNLMFEMSAENATNYAKEIFEKILLEEREIMDSKFKEIINARTYKAAKKSYVVVEKNINSLQEAAKKAGKNADVCVELISEKFRDISDVDKCVRAAKNNTIEIDKLILQTYALLFECIYDLRKLIENCVNESQDSTACTYYDKVEFFQNSIKKAYDLVKGSFERLEEIIPGILKDFEKCMIVAEEITVNKYEGAINDLLECYKAVAEF